VWLAEAEEALAHAGLLSQLLVLLLLLLCLLFGKTCDEQHD
jgi:hypothetical protein